MSQALSDFGMASVDSLDAGDVALIGRQNKVPDLLTEDQSAKITNEFKYVSSARSDFAAGDFGFPQFSSQLDHTAASAAEFAPANMNVLYAAAIEAAPAASHLAPLTDLEPYPAVFDVTTLDGTNGFTFHNFGADVFSNADFNGDGFSDIIIGAGLSHTPVQIGEGLVMYGHAASFPAAITPDYLDGTTGFAMLGQQNARLGVSVSGIGDFNGDGFDDIVVGDTGPNSSPNGAQSGISYVVFGTGTPFNPFISPQTLPSTRAVQILGTGTFTHNAYASAAGDVNGDGFADLIVGHDISNRGNTYVVFGHGGGFSSTFDLSTINGSNGFMLTGVTDDRDGQAVSGAGDVNGDGFADIIVGAWGDNSFDGAAYVVFGHAGGFSANIDLASLSGSDGFKLTGATHSYVGMGVASVGDVNGDGFSDVAVSSGVGFANTTTYIVFGHGGSFASNFDLTTVNGSNGVQILGGGATSAGDVNGDGFNDLIVGNAGGPGNLDGNAYVVFGQASGFSATFDVSTLNGTNGFKIAGETTGPNVNNQTGIEVSSAGDLNGDGFGDLIVAGGATSYDNNDPVSYVIYGRLPDASVNRTGTVASQTLAGGNFDDILSGLGGNDQLYGNGGNDTLTGGTGADTYHFSSSGPANVDTVTDYSVSDGDKIDLSGLLDAHTVTALNLSDYVQLVVTGGDLTVQVDTDGTGSGVTWADVAVLTGAATSAVNVQIGAYAYVVGSAGDDTVTGPAVTPGLFDLSAGGDDTATGGSGDDGFKFAAAYTPADHVDGGAGGNDQIALQGDYSAGVTLSGSSIANVEVMALLPGFNYNFTTTDDLVASGQTMSFWSVLLTSSNHVTVDGSAETDGAFKFYLGQGDDVAIGGAGADLFYGEGGADTLTGNGGADIFASKIVSDSTGATYDTITDFTAGTDKFDLPVTVLAVDATVATGALSTGSFDTDLAAAVGSAQLAAGDAVLFTPDSGSLATHTFLIVDANGTAGYQAGADYVFDVTGGSLGGLAAGDFI